MSLRHGLQTIVRVVRRRVQQQVQQHGHVGRQKPDVATPNPAKHYHSSGPTKPNVSPRSNHPNLASRAAQTWRLTPSSGHRFTQANGSRSVPASRPVLPLLLGFAGIGLLNHDDGTNLQGHEDADYTESGINLHTAIQVVQSVFKDQANKNGHQTEDLLQFPDELSGYTFSKAILAKGTEGVVFATKKKQIPSPDRKEEFAGPRDDAMRIPDGQHRQQLMEQRSKELAVCDDKDCDLAVKMMFNYNVGSTAANIMADFEAEQLPLLLAGGTFSRSNELNHKRSRDIHPNIVQVHRAFVDEVRVPSLSSAVSMFDMALPARLNPIGLGADTTMYLVMKRYRSSLRDYLNTEHGLLDRTIIVIVAQLLEAVGFLGSQGVVHRDLKTNNILVDFDDGSEGAPHVVVADFGCALSLRGRNLRDAVSMEDRNRQGNAALMAPEVKKALHQKCLRYHDYLKSDAWAVGAIMYEVCGQGNPFYSGHVNSDGYAESQLPKLQTQAVGLRIVSELLLNKDPGKRPSAMVAANILHLFLWQPSIGSLVRLCHGCSTMDSELAAWIIKVTLMYLWGSDKSKSMSPLNSGDPGIPRGQLETKLLETFLERVTPGCLKDATQHLVNVLRPLVLSFGGSCAALSPLIEIEQSVLPAELVATEA